MPHPRSWRKQKKKGCARVGKPLLISLSPKWRPLFWVSAVHEDVYYALTSLVVMPGEGDGSALWCFFFLTWLCHGATKSVPHGLEWWPKARWCEGFIVFCFLFKSLSVSVCSFFVCTVCFLYICWCCFLSVMLTAQIQKAAILQLVWMTKVLRQLLMFYHHFSFNFPSLT